MRISATIPWLGGDHDQWRAMRIMVERHPDMLVGAGTVLTTEQVDKTIAAGGKFVVTPGLDPEIVKYCQEKGITCFPGCTTPPTTTPLTSWVWKC